MRYFQNEGLELSKISTFLMFPDKMKFYILIEIDKFFVLLFFVCFIKVDFFVPENYKKKTLQHPKLVFLKMNY